MYIIRHPETVFNKRGIIQGHADSPLTTRGIEIAHKLGEKLSNYKITKIYSSDLGRCKETAKIIKEYVNCKIVYSMRLREINYGIYNGKPLKEYTKKYKVFDPDRVIPDGESLNQMKKRVTSFLTELKEDDLLIITHYGALHAVLLAIEGKNIINTEDFYKKDISIDTIVKIRNMNGRLHLS